MKDIFPFGNGLKVTCDKLYQFLELVHSQSILTDVDNQLTFFQNNYEDPIQNIKKFSLWLNELASQVLIQKRVLSRKPF